MERLLLFFKVRLHLFSYFFLYKLHYWYSLERVLLFKMVHYLCLGMAGSVQFFSQVALFCVFFLYEMQDGHILKPAVMYRMVKYFCFRSVRTFTVLRGQVVVFVFIFFLWIARFYYLLEPATMYTSTNYFCFLILQSQVVKCSYFFIWTARLTFIETHSDVLDAKLFLLFFFTFLLG